MYDLIKILFDISLFKKGPEDLPYSKVLAKLLIVTYSAIRFMLLNMALNWQTAIIQIGFEIVYIAGFSWLILYFNRKLARYVQLTNALFGVFALLAFISLPAYATVELGRGGLLVMLAMLILMGWYCAVTTHIFYHTMDYRLGMSVGLGLLFLIGAYLLPNYLFSDQYGLN